MWINCFNQEERIQLCANGVGNLGNPNCHQVDHSFNRKAAWKTILSWYSCTDAGPMKYFFVLMSTQQHWVSKRNTFLQISTVAIIYSRISEQTVFRSTDSKQNVLVS